MAQLPKFREKIALDVAGTGIVQSSGARAQAQLFGTAANVFQQANNVANQILDQRAKEEGAKAGEEAARSKSFDVTNLRNDNTIYGNSYRSSALETYSIGIASDTSNELARVEAANSENPDNFLKTADAIRAGVINNAPIEIANNLDVSLRNSINATYKKLGNAKAERDTQLAKNQFDTYVKTQKERIASFLASGDNDNFILSSAQLKAIVDATSFIPEEVKPIYLENISNEIQDNAIIVQSANSEDPLKVLEATGNLNAANVQNALALKASMENSRIADQNRKEKALREEGVALQDETYLLALDNNVDAISLNNVRRKLVDVYGMSVGEVETFTSTINDVIAGKEIVSNVGIVEELQTLIRDVDPGLEEFFNKNKIYLSPDDRNNFADRISVLRSKAMQDPRVKDALDLHVYSVYPIYNDNEYSGDEANQIAKSNRENRLSRDYYENELRKAFDAKEVAVPNVGSFLRNLVNQEGGDKYIVQNRINSLPEAQRVRISAMVNSGIEFEQRELVDGVWRKTGKITSFNEITNENASKVIQAMRAKNDEMMRRGRNTMPYSKADINALESIFGLEGGR